jgi:hypothetical protein
MIHVSEAAVADAIHIAKRITPNQVEINWVEAKSAAVRRSGMPVRVSSEGLATR